MMRSRRTWVVLCVLVALVAGGSVWLWQGRQPAMTGKVKVTEPSTSELATFADTKIFFGHMSVGSNVISGIGPTYAAAGRAAPSIVETRDTLAEGAGFLAHAHMGVNGEPFGKFDDFAAVINGPLGDQVDVALLKLCYADVVNGTDVEAVFAAYTKMMAELERGHPAVRFLYTTVPLSTDRGWKSTIKSWIGQDDQMGPADNTVRQRYNELVRQRYGATGRLFDIAAVEATMTETPMQRSADGQTYYVLNGALAADPGHLNDLGSRVAATEFIRVVAGVSR